MRTIRFRAWDEQNKIMHNDFQFIKSGDEGNDWIVFTSDKQTLQDSTHPFENPYFGQQLKIMQYTGLKDKNGVKIFEGDVLKTETEKPMVVGWSERFASFVLNREGWLFSHWFGESCDPEKCEIIGNIHQNSELLK